MNNSKRYIATLIVFLLGFTFFNVPAISAHGGDTTLIHACVRNNTGAIRIITANGTCNSNEMPLDWRIQGEPGPMGPQGPIGPQGPEGPPGPTYSAGDGLNLSSNEFSANFAGTGTASTVARSDHTHTLANGEVTTEKIADNAVTSAKISNVVRGITANLMGFNSEFGISSGGLGIRLLSSGSTHVVYTFMVPFDYAGGDLTIREWWFQHDATGTAKVVRTMDKLTAGGQVVLIDSQVSFDVTTTCCIPSRTWTIPTASVSPGDVFWVELIRFGDDPTDTSGRLDLRAVGIEYQAEQ